MECILIWRNELNRQHKQELNRIRMNWLQEFNNSIDKRTMISGA